MNEHSSPDTQVAHRPETETLATAARALVGAVRTADAPTDVLAQATALVDEATALLDPYHDDATPGVSDLRPQLRRAGRIMSQDPCEFFPYSPVVGPLNPIAPPIALTFDGERVHGTCALSGVYAGPPGMVHGGVVALVFDELLGITNLLNGFGAFTGTLKIRYERPTPLFDELTLDAGVERVEGRKVFTAGTISASGQVTARAEGLFVKAELLDL
jgi:acyl-coenzyme A thioesterase PaaI-like protein